MKLKSLIKYVRILLILGFIASLRIGYAQEQKLKAVMIYKLAANIEWPSYGETFVIGTYGQPDCEAVLKAIANVKQLHGKKIVIKPLKNVNEISDCNILYISKSNQGRIEALSKFANDKNILVVSESLGGIQKGSAVNLLPIGDKVVYEISKTYIKKHSLKANDKLYTLAKKVY